MSWLTSSRLRAALLVLLVVSKCWVAALSSKVGIDGAYYMDVAGHVRDGHGLMTDVSLFNAAMPHFPHPTPIYPLWPLLLGYSARLVPIDVAAVWLPSLLWIATLFLGERLFRKLAPFPLGHPSIDGGVLFLLTFGMNPTNWRHATRPYTEPLGFLLLVLFLWRLVAYTRRPALTVAFELGLWCGLMILSRSQLVLVTVAMLTVLGGRVVVGPDRARALAHAPVVVIGVLVALSPWLAWLDTFTEVTPGTVLSFQTWQAQPGLTKVSVVAPWEGLGPWLLKRLEGVGEAYTPTGKYAYYIVFHGAEYVVFPGLVVAWTERRALWRWVKDPDNTVLLFVVVLGLGWMAQLHLLNKPFFSKWNFGLRHAIPAVAVIGPTIGWLLWRGGWARWAAAGCLVWSVVASAQSLGFGMRGYRASKVRIRANEVVGEWVRHHALPGEAPVAMMMDPYTQYVGRAHDGIGWHWVFARTPVADLQFIVRELDADFLITSAHSKAIPGNGDVAGFEALFVEREDAPDGWRVWDVRAAGDDGAGQLPKYMTMDDEEDDER